MLMEHGAFVSDLVRMCYHTAVCMIAYAYSFIYMHNHSSANDYACK
jgi:hypothetical protein